MSSMSPVDDKVVALAVLSGFSQDAERASFSGRGVSIATAFIAALRVEDRKIPVYILEGPQQFTLVDAGRGAARLSNDDGYDYTCLPSNAHQAVRHGVSLKVVQEFLSEVGIGTADLQDASGALVPHNLPNSPARDVILHWGGFYENFSA